MVIVSDTTAISNLIQFGEIQLLQKIFGEIIIPRTVQKELLKLKSHSILVNKFIHFDWVTVKNSTQSPNFKQLKKVLDDGEAEAISMAIELKADFLIIDEKEGRRIASEKDLKVIGTLGVLIEARKRGFIESLEKKALELKEKGFWVSQGLINQIIEIEKKLVS